MSAADPLLADDSDGSGVQFTEYSLDDGQTWQAYTGPFEITTPGETTIQYRSVDGAGNVEETKSQTVHLDQPLFQIFLPLVLRK